MNNKKTLIQITVILLVSILVTNALSSLINRTFKRQTKYKTETQVVLNLPQVGKEAAAITRTMPGQELLPGVPMNSDAAYVIVNDNHSFFTDEEKTDTDEFISLKELDRLGRTQSTFSCLSPSLLPEEDRPDDMSSVTPSGWKQCNVKEQFGKTIQDDGQEKEHLFERCHLQMFALTGITLDERNLFTGTLQCNQLMYDVVERQLLNTVKNTKKNVLYRVTPVFVDNERICRGVLMEGYSEDLLDFNIFIYNKQKGYVIDYYTSEVSLEK